MVLDDGEEMGGVFKILNKKIRPTNGYAEVCVLIFSQPDDETRVGGEQETTAGHTVFMQM